MKPWHWWLIAGLVAVHLGIDLIVPFVFRRDLFDVEVIFRLAGYGAMAGQISLVAAWAVFTHGRWIVRLPGVLVITMLIWGALVLGNRACQHPIGPDRVALLGTILFGAVMLVQAPLWLTGMIFGWRLMPAGVNLETSTQFSLRQMLTGMTLVAAALAGGRLILPTGQLPWDLIDRRRTILLLIGVIGNVVLVLPCIWVAFCPFPRLPQRALLWLTFCLAVSGVELGIVFAEIGPRYTPFVLLTYTAILAFNLVQCGDVILTLLVLRQAGFRLERVVA